MLTKLFNQQLWNSVSVKEKRRVYNEAKEKTPAAASEKQLTAAELDKKLEDLATDIDKNKVDFKPSIPEISKEFAKKMDLPGNQSVITSLNVKIENAIRKGFERILAPNFAMTDLLAALANGGKKMKNKEGEDVPIPKIKSAAFVKNQNTLEIQLGLYSGTEKPGEGPYQFPLDKTAGVPIATPPPQDKTPAAPPEKKQPTTETQSPKKETKDATKEANEEKPEELGIRQIDKEAEAAEKAKQEIKEKGEAKRQQYIDGGLMSGTIKPDEKGGTKVTATLSDLYPDAVEGDTVDIVRYGKRFSAEYKNGQWINTKKPKESVKIFKNDRISYAALGHRERGPKAPESPKGYEINGYMRMRSNMAWLEIARSIMYMGGNPPNGDDFRKLLNYDQKPQANSPAQALKDLGYDTSNKEDVAAYATILKEVNAKSPLYVWIIMPTKNPRAIKEAQKREEKKAKEQAAERAKQVARMRSAEDEQIVNKNFIALVNNKNFRVPPRIDDIVNDDALWNYYWKKGFKGKELLVRGFAMWDVKENEIRNRLHKALTGSGFWNINEEFNFEDLLEEFGVFKNLNGEVSHDIDEFNEEYIFQHVGLTIENNLKAGREDFYGVRPHDLTIYNKYSEKYKDSPELSTGERFMYYRNIIKGASFIVEGLKNLDTAIPIETARSEIKAAKEKTEQMKEAQETTGEVQREHTEPLSSDPAEVLLQTLFHPQNAKAMEDMAETGEKSCEATIYRQIKLLATVNGKLDKTALVKELNVLIRAGLQKYLAVSNDEQTIARIQTEIDELKKQEKTDATQERIALLEDQIEYINKTRSDSENMRRRCGLTGSGLENSRDLAQMENIVQIKQNLAIPTQNGRTVSDTRNLITEGFEYKRYMDAGAVEKTAELKPWRNFEQLRTELKDDKKWGTEVKRLERLHMLNGVLKDAQNPQTAMTLREFYSRNPDAELNEEKLKKEMKEIDDIISTSTLFELDLAVDTTDKDGNQWRLGIVKRSVDLGKGWKFIYGGGINLSNGQPFFGGGIVKEAKVSKEWTADIGATAGFEPFALRPFAGVDGGFTWIIPGEDGWDTKIVPLTRGGVGASASINLSQLYLGPHIDASIGREANPKREYKLRQEQTHQRLGYHNVEAAETIEDKAAAIRALPEVGPFLFEMQVNNNWSDEKLVNFYNEYLKKTIDVAIMRENVESTGLISAYGVGGMVDPLKLAIVTGAFLLGGPLLAGPLVVSFFGKLGIFIGNKLVFDQELLESQGETQRKADMELIKQINAAYPQFKIEIGPQTLEGRERVESNEFTGDMLQRILKTERKPTNTEFSEIEAEPTRNFEALQQEFIKHNIRLTLEEIEPGIKMYRIQLLNTESYSIFADPQMAAGHNIITKNGKIYIATTENLSQIHLKRFDAFFPGEIGKGGSVQHTIVTISDNPYHRMGDIAKDSYFFVESIYNRSRSTRTIATAKLNEARIVPEGATTLPSRVFDYNKHRQQLNSIGGVSKFYTADRKAPETIERETRQARKAGDLALTNEAMAVAKDFDKEANINSVLPNPKDFLKKYPALYRELTTNPTSNTLQKLDELVRKECKDSGQVLSEEQVILYKEELYQRSMSEQRESTPEKTIEKRLNWAEKAIFTPFFEKGLERMRTSGQEIPQTVTGASLAASFMTTIRHSLRKAPRQLRPGESIFTAVGTPDNNGHIWNGIRKIVAATGETTTNQIVEAFDFSSFISLPEGEKMDTEQEIIARILFDEHNEIPSVNTDFLRSRLAKKLMFLGNEKQSNPIINLLHENAETSSAYFKTLIAAYRELAEGKTVDLEKPPYKDAVDAFKKLCEKVKQAQLGEGTPLQLDGQEFRALYMNGYYMLISTNVTSGIYDFCKNPATVYNERIIVYKPKDEQAFRQLLGTVTSTAQYNPVTYNARRSLQSVGINAIFNKEFDSEEKTIAAPPGEPGATGHVEQPPTGKQPNLTLVEQVKFQRAAAVRPAWEQSPGGGGGVPDNI